MSSRRRRRPDVLRPTGEILHSVLGSLGLSGRLREREALELWTEMVGPDIAGRSEALRIREGVLYVRVESAAWRQELSFLKTTIIGRFDEALGSGLVKEIRFTQH